MNYLLENNYLTVSIKAKGAELSSIINKQNQLEYLWGADPKFWAKSSPVLFPIVGTLKDNTYNYKNKSYSLSRHGFARDENFQVVQQAPERITFQLTSSTSSLVKYPFHFELRISYQLNEHELQTTYEVKNTSRDVMYFSLGAHPAFKAPLLAALQYEDYYLQFSDTETAHRWPITHEGLIDSQPEPLLNNVNRLPLTRALFARDAVVLKQLKSKRISLKSDKNSHGLDFDFDGFPFLGIWAQPGADFVCIEPWCGIADSVNHNQQLITKEGIENLAADASWSRSWSVKVY